MNENQNESSRFNHRVKLNGVELPVLPAPIDEDAFDAMWLGGSLLYPEAVVLYNTVRQQKPSVVLEAGSFVGVSSLFLINGLRDNGHGHLISVDRQGVNSQFMMTRHGCPRSDRVKGDDRKMVTIVTGKAQDFMSAMPECSVDMVFEDTSHTKTDTREICLEAIRILRPGGILMSHDALMASVQGGYKEAKIFHETGFYNCGLSLWRKPTDG